MTESAVLFGICGAILTAIGLYGFVAARELLRRIVAFNMAGSGIFLLLGALGRRGLAAGVDPVPQALIITGIVVALSATALALALVARLAALRGDPPAEEDEP